MKELTDKVSELKNKYEEQFVTHGIKISISRRYFEKDVEEKISGTANAGAALFAPIERALDREREVNKGYNYQPNRFHCILLSVMPVEKSLVKKDDCREYAFVVEKVTRAHIGIEPAHSAYKEDKILAKIEKRILKILKRASKKSVIKICKNSVSDIIRYSFSPKYEYKTEYCGKERFTWDMIFGAIAASTAFLFVFILWSIRDVF